jgi:hypothetical protein
MDVEAVMRLVALITVIQAIFSVNLPLGKSITLPDATEPRAQTIGKTYGGRKMSCYVSAAFLLSRCLLSPHGNILVSCDLASNPPLKRPRPVRLQEKATE